ncbi:MAG: hypothetical protein ABSE62_00395 [Chthoniobacteraceae bacterium]|jgi:hypothetical protein
MVCALSTTTAWQRARAALLHEHFCGIRARLTLRVSTLTGEIERMSQLVNGKLLSDPDDHKQPRYLKATPATLRLHELDAAVAEAIERHNTESGHAYKGHGTHFEEEVQPGVWKRRDEPPAQPTPHRPPTQCVEMLH